MWHLTHVWYVLQGGKLSSARALQVPLKSTETWQASHCVCCCSRNSRRGPADSLVSCFPASVSPGTTVWQTRRGHGHQVCAHPMTPWWWPLAPVEHKKVTENPSTGLSCKTIYLSSFSRPLRSTILWRVYRWCWVHQRQLLLLSQFINTVQMELNCFPVVVVRRLCNAIKHEFESQESLKVTSATFL